MTSARFAKIKDQLGYRFLLATLSVLLITSCGNGGQAPFGTDTPKDPGRKTSFPTSARHEPQKRPVPPRPQLEPLEKVFDFATNLHRGHLRSKGLLIDFGTPARHKHTLGDWRSGWTGDFETDEASYSLISGSAAHVFFDSKSRTTKKTIVTFRARGETRNSAKVYLNGEYQGSVEFPSTEFAHASLKITDELHHGQNKLLIRCDGKKRHSATKKGRLAVDYIRISTEDQETGPAASAFNSVLYPNSAGGPDGILLAQGESITFNLPMDQEMRMRGKARARQLDSKANLEISVSMNDGKEETLFHQNLGNDTTRIDLSLNKYVGDTVALTLGAQGGEVVLQDSWLGTKKQKRNVAPGTPKAKNVVLVLIDTLRADRLSVYNESTRVRTPCLDILSKESMTFERAYAPENWTKPSIASLLTGLYPATHKAKDDRDKVPTSVTMASEHFKKIGFETAGFVANGYVSNKFGFRQGWGTWTNYVREGKANRAKYVMEDSSDWLMSRRSDKPFFLYVHTIDPHVPYIPPQKYLQMYDSARYNGPIKSTQTAHQLAAIKTRKLKLNERDKIRLEALYDGEITYHDDQLINLYETLKVQGLLDNTIVIVTSDHGEEFFEHGSVGHGHSMYEELLHVPLLIRLPGATEGEVQTSKVEVNLVDVLPTICDVLGVECPPGVEGRSLTPLLDGTGSLDYPGCSFSEFLGGQRAARMGRYKIIYKGLGASLYDLNEDPRETDNLSSNRPVSLAAMRDALGLHLGMFSDKQQAGETKTKKKHKTVKTVIDKETEAQLKALGYLNEE